MVKKGDLINLKDGTKAIVNSVGLPDFLDSPYPIYCTNIDKGEALVLLSTELKKREIK